MKKKILYAVLLCVCVMVLFIAFHSFTFLHLYGSENESQDMLKNKHIMAHRAHIRLNINNESTKPSKYDSSKMSNNQVAPGDTYQQAERIKLMDAQTITDLLHLANNGAEYTDVLGKLTEVLSVNSQNGSISQTTSIELKEISIHLANLIQKKRLHELYTDYSFDFVITPSTDVCAEDIPIVVFVVSATRNWDRRAAIRASWGAVTRSGIWPPGDTVKADANVVFITAFDRYWDAKLKLEAATYDDIISVSHLEQYEHLTLKSLSILKYAVQFCRKAQYIVKADDDILLDIPHLVDILTVRKDLPEKSMMGICHKSTPVLRDSKWQVPDTSFPFKNYPLYLGGSLYIINNDIVEELYKMAHFVPLIPIEDAYITGLLGGITKAKHICFNHMYAGYIDNYSSYVCDAVNHSAMVYFDFDALSLITFWKDLFNSSHC